MMAYTSGGCKSTTSAVTVVCGVCGGGFSCCLLVGRRKGGGEGSQKKVVGEQNKTRRDLCGIHVYVDKQISLRLKVQQCYAIYYQLRIHPYFRVIPYRGESGCLR